MRILGIDPGYAIVGFGVVSYHGADFTPLELFFFKNYSG